LRERDIDCGFSGGTMRSLAAALCALGVAGLAMILTEAYLEAHQCDFLTGGGWVVATANGTHPPDKGTFAIGGGCKNGSGLPGQETDYWGHLEYQDHYTGLDVHWTAITYYNEVGPSGAPSDPKRTGTRFICGRARTNMYGPDDVDFLVSATDNGEPGDSDEFWIRLSQNGVILYTTQHDPYVDLGGPNPGGGNIQLHKPNASNDGVFGGSCPAYFAQ
jgi:hypothetical protein